MQVWHCAPLASPESTKPAIYNIAWTKANLTAALGCLVAISRGWWQLFRRDMNRKAEQDLHVSNLAWVGRASVSEADLVLKLFTMDHSLATYVVSLYVGCPHGASCTWAWLELHFSTYHSDIYQLSFFFLGGGGKLKPPQTNQSFDRPA